jgi:AraC-like DNA-binding protein
MIRSTTEQMNDELRRLLPTPYNEIDQEEVHRLYFIERISQAEIAKRYGYKSPKPIRRIFRGRKWKTRPASVPAREVDPEEVYRLYFEEKKSLKEIAKHFGYVSINPIRRIFKEQTWKTRCLENDIDVEELKLLYFEMKRTLKEVSEYYECSHATIRLVLKKNGLKARNLLRDINPEEVYHLYFDRKLSLKKVSEYLGCSQSTIRLVFEKHGFKARKRSRDRKEINSEEVRKLYFEEGKTMKEVGQHDGFQSGVPIARLFREQEWSSRIRSFESDKEREVASREYYDTYMNTVAALRDKIFGTVCKICGKEKKIIHKKDGESHEPKILWAKDSLEALNPNEWVALCRGCHLIVHAFMKRGCAWNEIYSLLKSV